MSKALKVLNASKALKKHESMSIEEKEARQQKGGSIELCSDEEFSEDDDEPDEDDLDFIVSDSEELECEGSSEDGEEEGSWTETSQDDSEDSDSIDDEPSISFEASAYINLVSDNNEEDDDDKPTSTTSTFYSQSGPSFSLRRARSPSFSEPTEPTESTVPTPKRRRLERRRHVALDSDDDDDEQ